MTAGAANRVLTCPAITHSLVSYATDFLQPQRVAQLAFCLLKLAEMTA